MQYRYVCPQCNQEFFSKFRNRKFCTYSCKSISMKTKFKEQTPNWRGGQIKRICLTCRKEFFVDPHRINYNRGKFCSKHCLAKRNYGHQSAPKKQLFCIICDKPFYEYISNLIRESNRGKCCSKECRVKYTQQRISGKNSYLWKGGITPINRLQRYQMKARNWSKAIKVRDNFTCQICRIRSHKGLGKHLRLESHHIKNWADYPKLRYEFSNGITLCRDCHDKLKEVRLNNARKATSKKV